MSRCSHIDWTPERIETLKRLRLEGKTYPEIAEKMKIGKQSIFRRLEVLGLTNRVSQERSLKQINPLPSSQRYCLCCEKPFSSAGPHNRLCLTCRRKDVSPYAL